jgi:hypothetical protein
MPQEPELPARGLNINQSTMNQSTGLYRIVYLIKERLEKQF